MPQTKTAKPEWMRKKEAAAMLKVSIRQLEYRQARGQIQVRYAPKKSHETASPVEYNTADIQAILDHQPNKYAMPDRPLTPAAIEKQRQREALRLQREEERREANGTAGPLETGERGGELMRKADAPQLGTLAVLLEAMRATQPLAKPWLTLDEAAAYSGLPASYLRARAIGGTVHAVNVGQGRHAFWRFNRESLGNIV